MAPEHDSERLRRILADRVTNELAEDLPRVSAHLGEEYAEAVDDPDARSLRDSNGSFQWVAFGFEPYSMWDVHVGVLVEDDSVVVGFHIHERVVENPPQEAVTDEIKSNTVYRHSEIASEHQYNLPATRLDDVDVDEVATEIADLCRRIAPVVDDVVK